MLKNKTGGTFNQLSAVCALLATAAAVAGGTGGPGRVIYVDDDAPAPGSQGDFNADGVVNTVDLGLLLQRFGCNRWA